MYSYKIYHSLEVKVSLNTILSPYRYSYSPIMIPKNHIFSCNLVYKKVQIYQVLPGGTMEVLVLNTKET